MKIKAWVWKRCGEFTEVDDCGLPFLYRTKAEALMDDMTADDDDPARPVRVTITVEETE